ncbi:hypothetical protein FBEOM_2595 [Fusarium beomiforme]|uniref:Uncharacterized protein n=1 Tax=Fusarium beomiforme TaxID=44412 RepID=A0A9P5E347_9HYPO|nr:hypothetical protein FBEOM_2595 [Fusarium beomiforme]
MEIEASEDAVIESCKANEEPDEDVYRSYEDAEPCVDIAAHDEETEVSDDRVIAASEGKEIETLDMTEPVGVGPFERVESGSEELELWAVEVTGQLVVIEEPVTDELEVIVQYVLTEQSVMVELLVKLQS